MTFTRFKLAAAALLLAAMGSAALFGQASDRDPAGRSAAAGKPDPVPANEDRVELEMLERAWADAVNRRDAVVLGRIMADEFEGIDPVGSTFDKASYLARLRDRVTAPMIELAEMKVRLFGDTGIVISRVKTNAPQPHEQNETRDEGLRQAARAMAMRGVARRLVPRHELCAQAGENGKKWAEEWSSGSRFDR